MGKVYSVLHIRPQHKWNRYKLPDRTFHKNFKIHQFSLKIVEKKERHERIRCIDLMVDKDNFLEVAFTKKTSFAEERLAQLLRGKGKRSLSHNNKTENIQNEPCHNNYLLKDIGVLDANYDTNNNCSS